VIANHIFIYIQDIPEMFMISPIQGRLFNLYFIKYGREIAHRSFIHIKDNFFLNLLIPKSQFGNFTYKRFIPWTTICYVFEQVISIKCIKYDLIIIL
jgi:hypothetical protein